MNAAIPGCAPGLGSNEVSRTASAPGLREAAFERLRKYDEALVGGSGPVTPDSHSQMNDRTAGVDTWRLGFRIGRRPPAHRFKLDVNGADYHGFWFPDRSLVSIEGHPLVGGLCPPELLGDLHEQVHEAVEDVCGRAEPTGVLRLDSTAQVSLGGSGGLAALRGLASVVANVPGLKPGVIGKPVETVNLLSRRGSGAKLGRGYDPSFRGVTVRGEVVRLEAQDRQLALDYGLNALTPRERFHKRFGPVWRASQNVTVVGFPNLTTRLLALVEDGECSAIEAGNLGGFVLMQAAGGDRLFSQPTSWRRRRRLLELGVALADDSLFEPVEVDLGHVFETAMECPEWL